MDDPPNTASHPMIKGFPMCTLFFCMCAVVESGCDRVVHRRSCSGQPEPSMYDEPLTSIALLNTIQAGKLQVLYFSELAPLPLSVKTAASPDEPADVILIMKGDMFM